MTTKILDWREKQKVTYAVQLFIRDEQVKAAIARVKGRIQPASDELRAERRDIPIAVVGFGPSLTDTWEQIRDFKYVITCSGSHKFLIERGIVPTWHVEVDPRPHKITLLGDPHPDVEYLVASTCCPQYFEHLEGFNVKLWHVFDATNDGLRLLPQGEWAVTGGCDVGLRAMSLSAFMGFRNLHVFGMDGSARGEDRHAGAHPNGKQKYSEVNYNGKKFYTTPAMLEASRQTIHELAQMPAVTATFYGEGLTQEMTRNRDAEEESKIPRQLSNIVGISKPELISSEYRELNARLHHDNLAYGVGGGKHAPVVIELVEKAKCRSVLDYGCGKGYLAKAVPFPVWEYDPAIPGKEESPRPAELVVCTDVLEHIEPDKLLFVLDDLRRVVQKVGFFIIHTGPAGKTLSDGRNTHLIQKDKRWWEKQLGKFFQVARIWQVGPEVYVIVGPSSKKTKAAMQTVVAQ